MKKMYRYKDGNTLVNVSSSILKYFGVSPQHKTYEPLDKLLEKNKDKKIVLFLFDAMGKKTLTTYKDVAPFIYKHKFQTVSAVFHQQPLLQQPVFVMLFILLKLVGLDGGLI